MLSVLAIRRFTRLLEKLNGSSYVLLLEDRGIIYGHIPVGLLLLAYNVEYSSSIINRRVDALSLCRGGMTR